MIFISFAVLLLLSGVTKAQDITTESHIWSWEPITTQVDGKTERNLAGYEFCLTEYESTVCEDLGNVLEITKELPQDGYEYCGKVRGYDVANNRSDERWSETACIITADKMSPGKSPGCSVR